MTPCIEWDGYRSPRGYGRTKVKGRDLRVHRWAWEQEHGPIPAGLHVLHRCDNPPCYNVDHLFLGTQLDNVRDCMEKGRRATPPVPRLAGDAHGRAKLTRSQAREILRLCRAGACQKDLAKVYDVSTTAINRIAMRRTWMCLDNAIETTATDESQ